MSVNLGAEQAYERRHRPAYAEIEDEARWAAIAATPECQKWWRHMGDIMPSNPDHSPVSRDLRELFHLP
ncbi:MAG: L-rhamnose mutarotase [Opitutaceae bacterium]|jgi:L-rhamnose mutarotase